MQIVLQLALLAVGFVMLVKGSDWFVDGAAGIAAKFRIPQIIIGLTIVAMGTSAPEAAVSITAATAGSADITVGNVVGSNIMNVLVILGLASAIIPIAVGKSTLKIDIPFMIAISVIFLLLGWDSTITRIDGLVLIALFAGYIGYMIWEAIHSNEDGDEIKDMPVWKLLLSTVIGMALIIFGADVAVDAATKLAQIFGMSERFIGLTVVALGTSLPELFTSVTAARNGQRRHRHWQHRRLQHLQHPVRCRPVFHGHQRSLRRQLPHRHAGRHRILRVHLAGCPEVQEARPLGWFHHAAGLRWLLRLPADGLIIPIPPLHPERRFFVYSHRICHLERNEVESRDLRMTVTYQVESVRRSLDSLCSLGMTCLLHC